MKFIEIMLLLFFLYSIGFFKAEATEFYDMRITSIDNRVRPNTQNDFYNMRISPVEDRVRGIEDRLDDLENNDNEY